jgi:Mrp family chromosome partitioning ATPase
VRDVTHKTDFMGDGAAALPADEAVPVGRARGGLWSRLFGRRALPDDAREHLGRLVQRLYLGGVDGAPLQAVILTCPSSVETAVEASVRLAEYLVEDPNRRVLLLDACLRRQELSRRFGAENAPGLLDVLAGTQRDWGAVVRPLRPSGMHLLPAGRTERDVFALMDAAAREGRLEGILRVAREQYAFVLIALPSLLRSTYALPLPSVADCTLLLVKPGETRRPEALNCKRVLEGCRARQVGIVTAGR